MIRVQQVVGKRDGAGVDDMMALVAVGAEDASFSLPFKAATSPYCKVQS
jgi:hypothetical protein